MTWKRTFVVVYVIFACLGARVFIMNHGGWTGDVDPYVATIANPEAKAVYAPGMVFNRWRTDYDHEPWLVRIFMMVNGPAYAVALLTYKALRIVPPFDGFFPFGISYPSYQLTLLLLFGLAQWYLVGALVEGWLGRRGKARMDTPGRRSHLAR